MTSINDLVKVSITDADNKPASSIVLRRGTANERTIRAVLERRQYDISHLRRRDEIGRLYQQIIAAGQVPLIVDLGANIGASALYLNHMWPGSKILAVEPEPANFRLLEENARAASNILPIHAGIAGDDGTLRIADRSAATDAFRTVFGEGNIRAISMATLLSSHVGEPFICKIDIEGAERDLFSKNTDWIDRFPLIMIELHDWMLCGQAASQSFLQAIAQRQRDFTFFGDTVFSIRC